MSRSVILVTGASRGLGRGVAEMCARAGWDVAVHYNDNTAAAEQTLALCRKAAEDPNAKFAAVPGNIARPSDRVRICETVLRTFGRIDGLVNNAGMAPRIRSDFTEMSQESYDEIMSVNLTGPAFLTQLIVKHWMNRPGKSFLPGGYKLIFITSISAETASINRGEYCISKAGLSMVAQLWATRLAAEGIQVFEIRPGIMATDMTAGVKEKYDRLIEEGLVPQKRWGHPEDVASAVQSILKGAFPYSTGAIFHVDGGFHLSRL